VRAAVSGTFAVILGVAAAFARAEAPDDLDVGGTWYVLVHLRDTASADPDAWSWDDGLWVFERHAGTLRWKVYPEPHFTDESGREDRSGSWEPSSTQRDEITRGLRVAPRGVLLAELDGSDEEGWRSPSHGVAVQSGLGFERRFEITRSGGRPVFVHTEGLVGAAADPLEGRTLYETREIEDGVLTGRCERDTDLRGRFRMWRSGAARRSTR
jgi:hypothetical protein